VARRRFTVVGRLCDSRADALVRLLDIRNAVADDPKETTAWGIAEIRKKAGTLRLPSPPVLLKRLEGLLSDREVRSTEKGRAALQLVRVALRKR